MKKVEKKKYKKADHELGVVTHGAAAVVRERAKQLDKGYTPQSDFENNAPGTLILAAQKLLSFDIHTRIDGKPNDWDEQIWLRQCIKPERDRLEVAGAWIASELDRYYFAEENDTEEVDAEESNARQAEIEYSKDRN